MAHRSERNVHGVESQRHRPIKQTGSRVVGKELRGEKWRQLRRVMRESAVGSV